MKTILVLSDFSIRAAHATQYAIKLAQKIEANVLLCNVFLVPSTTPMASQIAWPMENYEELQQNSTNDLDKMVNNINNELDLDILMNGGFRPNIKYCSKVGFVADAISEIAKSHHVIMVVIGTHAKHGLGSFLMGDHARDIIEKADYPVLLIPEMAKGYDLKTIAFATDLSHTDTYVLHSLSGLAKHYYAEILLTHVADESIADQKVEPAAKIFLSMVSSKVNYPKIYYRPIRGNNVVTGLDWIAAHTDIDMLVMVHRKKGFFESLFQGSITQKMAGHLTKPLLVFPCSKVEDTMPVF
ncbi:universal stress protein [Mucilaginibacter sp. HMF5004]|uniref:universal stress protein n=1 Tax=Mucilaginibacter rivuli TaxID=2857527 RepID=UPI001C5F12A0|nr:universal stress protein [Mucilaginibacter rivuli]MBW4891013.1 universal stress protein [Mucilaginibacter rivuli]